MFDQTLTPIHHQTAPIQRIFESNAEALTNAGALLAGSRGPRLVCDITTELSNSGEITRWSRGMLFDLRAILELKLVQDEGRIEAACFAAFNPWDSVFEDICLLTDRYRDALQEAGLDHPHASHWSAA